MTPEEIKRDKWEAAELKKHSQHSRQLTIVADRWSAALDYIKELQSEIEELKRNQFPRPGMGVQTPCKPVEPPILPKDGGLVKGNIE